MVEAAKREKRIKFAQNWVNVLIFGVYYARIRYGHEKTYSEDEECVCGVEKGQLHILGCQIECCPFCGTQSIVCKCESYVDEERLESIEDSQEAIKEEHTL